MRINPNRRAPDLAAQAFGLLFGLPSHYNGSVPEGLDLTLNAATRYCAVLGHPVRHSASPAMHNAALAELKLNWRYLALEVHPDQLRQAINGAKSMGFIGLNLTVPHKILALDIVDEVDPAARHWGAVNTIRFEGRDSSGAWQPLCHFTSSEPGEIRSHGFNTDADAIVQSLREDLDIQLAGAKILLLGAGGAGRVAALKLASENISELYLVNRTMEKAESVATEIRRLHPSVRVTVDYPHDMMDVVINGTSQGLKLEDAMPLDSRRFSLKHARAAYDMIYRPAETPFLKAAREAGCRVSNGLGMLLHQGARALELWTGKRAPVEIMRAALKKNIYGN
jgi:shikimate dehydrogenase